MYFSRSTTFLIIVTAVMAATTSCSRKKKDTTTLRFSIPKFSQSVSPLVVPNPTPSPNWGLSDQENISQLDCFYVFVSGPGVGPINTCVNSTNTITTQPNLAVGAFNPGEQIELEVTPGPARLVQVLGTKSVAGACKRYPTNNIDKANFARPYIIGQQQVDLSPGPRDITINATYTAAPHLQIDDCMGPSFNFPQPASPTPTPSPTPFQVAQLSAGVGSLCALSSNNKIKCWGQNNYGEVGAGIGGPFGNTPTTIGDDLLFIDTSSIGAGVYPTKINMGRDTACAIFSNNQLRCWGGNNQGKLGNGTTSPPNIGQSEPVSTFWAAVNLSASGSIPLDVGNGAAHTCALMANGTVWCWGYNQSGQLGDGTATNSLTPVQVSGITTASKLAVGESHNCVLTSGGQVYCWGSNGYGQLGDNSTTQRNSPVIVTGLPVATDLTVSISFGQAYSCAVTSSGGAKCWGANNQGQLGDGTNTNSPVPVSVGSPMASGVTHIDAGNGHVCAIKAGALYCWGAGGAGQLGQDNATSITSPQAVIGMGSNVTDITLGDVFTCAKFGTQAKCFGYGVYGALLQGTADIWGNGTPGFDMVNLPYLQLGNQ